MRRHDRRAHLYAALDDAIAELHFALVPRTDGRAAGRNLIRGTPLDGRSRATLCATAGRDPARRRARRGGERLKEYMDAGYAHAARWVYAQALELANGRADSSCRLRDPPGARAPLSPLRWHHIPDARARGSRMFAQTHCPFPGA